MENKVALSGHSFEPTSNPEKLVFLLHGYGDNSQNFISIASGLFDQSIKLNFYAPNAPGLVPQLSEGRQWFDLYPNGINFNQAGETEKKILIEDCKNSLSLIKDYILKYCSKYKLNYKDCFILGFSQGSMMAFELGKYTNKIYAGCILLSGRILPFSTNKSDLFTKTPIFISHGDEDTILEPKYFFEANKILQNQGFLFESHLINKEGHTISNKILKLTQKFIKKHIS